MDDGGTFSKASFAGVGPIAKGVLVSMMTLVLCCSTMCFGGVTFVKCAVDDLVGEPAEIVEDGILIGGRGGGEGGQMEDEMEYEELPRREEREEGGQRDELEIPLMQNNDNTGRLSKEDSGYIGDVNATTPETRRNNNNNNNPPSEMLASQTGATGIQPNAAIPISSPTIDYWALHTGAGTGARLDGKSPAPLKDKSGAEVDVRKIRAEAAARRAAEMAKSTASLPTTGKTIKGEVVRVDNGAAAVAVSGRVLPTRKNKSRVGGKFSKLKGGGTAFHGGSNQF
mmetsp:Transcript_37242/g.78018  ORF Transcript_37242/g.78018 Transcript_37242/m.78018 type:complete len:283 (+) Transcript_37242:521-1369(+)